MPIEKKFLEMISECEARLSELNEKTQKFIMGDGDKNPPLRERPYLGSGQKKWLKDAVERQLEGKKTSTATITKHGDCDGTRTDLGWRVTVSGHNVGPAGMSKKEVAIHTEWLNSALGNILALPADAVSNYQKGAAEEIEPEDDNVALGDGPEGNTEPTEEDCGF